MFSSERLIKLIKVSNAQGTSVRIISTTNYNFALVSTEQQDAVQNFTYQHGWLQNTTSDEQGSRGRAANTYTCNLFLLALVFANIFLLRQDEGPPSNSQRQSMLCTRSMSAGQQDDPVRLHMLHDHLSAAHIWLIWGLQLWSRIPHIRHNVPPNRCRPYWRLQFDTSIKLIRNELFVGDRKI